MTPLAIYLRNHEAAAQAGLDLFRRAASSQRHRAYGPELNELVLEVEADLKALRNIMRGHGVQPDPMLAVVLRLGERLARLKPNGHLVQRSPLSDLIEIEGMLDAVRAKAAGWQALTALDNRQPAGTVELDDLIHRATSQTQRLATIHVAVAADVLHTMR